MKIVALKRTKLGTSASKQARAAGKLPAVIYGKQVESLPVLIDTKEFEDTIREVGTNGVFTLSVDGQDYQVFVKETSSFATKPGLYHVDLQAFTAGEKVAMSIPVHVEGEELIIEGNVVQSISEIEIEIAPEEAPNNFTIDASKLVIGDSVTVGDIELPEGAELLSDAEETVLSITAPEDVSEDLETESVAEEMPEPEVIGEEDSDSE